MGGERVCITITGTNWTNDSICGPYTHCEDVIYTPCSGEPPIEDGEEGERRERKKAVNTGFDFKSYPNPVRNTLYLEWKYVVNTKIKLQLLNQEGQSVLRKEVLIEGRIFELPLNNLAEGVYVLEVEKGEEKVRKKIVIVQ